jgi:CheY-like chemotaxis protein
VNGKKYDLFLSDIKIPQMGGIEFYSYLKKEYPDMAEKIIFSSGDIMSGNTAEFLKESNRPFLPKPFTPDQLRLIVHETFDPKSNNPPGVQGALIPHENQ